MPLSDGTYDVHFRQNDSLVETGSLVLGGGSSLLPIAMTSGAFGISPSSNSTTNRSNLQDFINYVTDNDLVGVIDSGAWLIDDQLHLRSTTRLTGRGMYKTIIEADVANWTDTTDWTMMEHDANENGGVIGTGLYLADMKVIGGDTTRSDNGALVSLKGIEDFVVERMFFVDGSSYNLFISGYGVGSFTNDITDPFWNSLFRGTVRDCLSWRGQIGFGVEGGAESVLFERCTAIGNAEVGDMDWGLHAFRSASGYDITVRDCDFFGYRNGVLLDRYKHMNIVGNRMRRVRNGVAIGSFYSTDPEISKDVRIVNNYFDTEEENSETPLAINDAYISNRRVHGVTIQGNIIMHGRISLGQVRRAVVTGNIGFDSSVVISFYDTASGIAANNIASLSITSSNTVVDGGNNVDPTTIEDYF